MQDRQEQQLVQHLPLELWVMILQHLTPMDLTRVALVSKLLKAASNDNRMWFKKCKDYMQFYWFFADLGVSAPYHATNNYKDEYKQDYIIRMRLIRTFIPPDLNNFPDIFPPVPTHEPTEENHDQQRPLASFSF